MAVVADRSPILVLLPGLDGTGDLFAPLLEALAQAGSSIPTRVVRYPTDGAYDYATCESIAREVLPTDGQYVLLGESFSGPIATLIAASEPTTRGLRGLILCSTFVRNPRPGLSLLLRPFLPYMPFDPNGISVRLSRFMVLGQWSKDGAIRRLHHEILLRIPGETIRRRLETVANCDVTAALESLTVPVMCLTAAHDRLVPKSAGRWIKQRLRAATSIEVNAPHCLLQCAPEEAAAAIRRFVEATGSPAGAAPPSIPA